MLDMLSIIATVTTTVFGIAIQDNASLDTLLPAPPDGWRLDGEDAPYDRETIFEYMNGAGEVYLSFAYRGMIVRRLIDDDGNEIVIELYDMGIGADAFGIFARNWSGEEAGIGQNSEYRSGYLLFWQDRYFCTVFTYGENEKTEATIFELGKAISGKIGQESPLPPILALLPEEKLDRSSIRYFHLYTDLNQHYFVADENILDLGPETNAVLAQYSGEKHPAFLMIIAYPTSAQATAAFAAFTSAFMPESNGKPLQIEDGTWASAEQSGTHITAVFDASSREQAQNLLMQAMKKIREKKHE